MNRYLQIPRNISRSAQDFMDRNCIKYVFIHEREVPDEIPASIHFAGKEYTFGRFYTFRLESDADEVFKLVEEAFIKRTL